LVTARKYNGKFSVHLVNSPNKMALKHVNVLQVHQTGLCAYSIQTVLKYM